jgi:hypothetical protein
VGVLTVKGAMTYVVNGIIWHITRHGAWFAEITDAVPVGFKQPHLNRWKLDDLLIELDNYELELNDLGR